MTYPRRPMPTASMLHEMRMIAQTFFRHRTHQSIFSGGSESSPIYCVPCLRAGDKFKKAIAIDNGRSVCKNHL